MALGRHGYYLRSAGSTVGVAAAADGEVGYEDLKAAIVHRACVDYLILLQHRTHSFNHAVGDPGEVERFFRSAWFRALCDADGEALILALRRISRTKRKTIQYARYSEYVEECTV